jgi:hypothetical protein
MQMLRRQDPALAKRFQREVIEAASTNNMRPIIVELCSHATIAGVPHVRTSIIHAADCPGCIPWLLPVGDAVRKASASRMRENPSLVIAHATAVIDELAGLGPTMPGGEA